MQINIYVGWYRKTNANVIKLYKMKDISIFHQYFGTIDSFIYKAYYIDFFILKRGKIKDNNACSMQYFISLKQYKRCCKDV